MKFKKPIGLDKFFDTFCNLSPRPLNISERSPRAPFNISGE